MGTGITEAQPLRPTDSSSRQWRVAGPRCTRPAPAPAWAIGCSWSSTWTTCTCPRSTASSTPFAELGYSLRRELPLEGASVLARAALHPLGQPWATRRAAQPHLICGCVQISCRGTTALRRGARACYVCLMESPVRRLPCPLKDTANAAMSLAVDGDPECVQPSQSSLKIGQHV